MSFLVVEFFFLQGTKPANFHNSVSFQEVFCFSGAQIWDAAEKIAKAYPTLQLLYLTVHSYSKYMDLYSLYSQGNIEQIEGD